jgi:hypothetical protein
MLPRKQKVTALYADPRCDGVSVAPYYIYPPMSVVPEAYSDLSISGSEEEYRVFSSLDKWLRLQGVTCLNLQLQCFAVDYRGVCTTCDIKEDHNILEVSIRVMLVCALFHLN